MANAPGAITVGLERGLVPFRVDGSLALPSVTIAYSAPLTELTEGAHTADVQVMDEVGNPSEGTLIWCVDASPPAVQFDSSPQAPGCGTDPIFGVVEAASSGVVTFARGDNGPPCGVAGVASLTCTLQVDASGTWLDLSNYVDVDCTDGSFEYGSVAGFSPLNDGHYVLHVTAIDAVTNPSDPTHQWHLRARVRGRQS